MARPSAAVISTDAPMGQRFERLTRGHVLELARTKFLNGERVDMQNLCADLGISRTTLYRWVGDRDQLYGEVLAELTKIGWQLAGEQATGSGLDRALDAGQRFMELTASFPPLRQFAEREPQLALRVLLDPDGQVAEQIRNGFREALERDAPHVATRNPESIEIAVQVGTALEWAPIAIGRQPEIERAAGLIRTLFETSA